jgi:hypothetical protein
MAGLSAGGGGGFDYIQSAQPADPDEGALWWDTDGGTDGSGEAKVWDGSSWDATGYVSHDQLTNVSPADHHDPVTVSAPITRSAQVLALAYTDPFVLDTNDDLALSIGNALALDSNNDLAVQEGQISHDNLAGVSDADHHDPVTVSAPLTRSTQALALAYGNALGLDNNNDLAVQEGQISHDNLAGVSADDHHNQNHDNSDHTTNYLPSSNYDPEADTHSKTTSGEIDHDSTIGGTDSNAHHSRPTGTQQSSSPTHDIVRTMPSGSTAVPCVHVTKIGNVDGNDPRYSSYYFGDGTSYENLGTDETIQKDGFLTKITTPSSYSVDIGYSVVEVPPHSHTI